MSDEVAKRGRKPIEINREEFQVVIRELEEKNVFPNRSALWAVLEHTEWARTRSPRPLTAQVAMMKAEEFGLEIKTEKGKRGRTKGEKPPASSGRRKKSFSLPMLESGVPVEEREKLAKTLEKAANGSLKARIKLNCLNCTNWQPVEVRMCEARNCPMWDVRPYKDAKKLETGTDLELTAT